MAQEPTPAAAAKVSISAVAICRNEEDDLPGLIANLMDWVDELIVIDDESDDHSQEILDAAGVKVRCIVQPMTEEGYAGQRNAGIAQAKGDWLLHMDCDERVPTTLRQEILQRIAETQLNGFRYRRLNFFLQRPILRGGWSSWNNPQLARRGMHRFEGVLHERCVIEGGEALTGQLVNKMLHLNDASFAERLEKSNRYVAINAQRDLDAGKPVNGPRILGATCAAFLKRYILQKGFLDGTVGLIAAMHAATAVFRERALVWDRQNAIPRSQLESLARE
ncbi:MAG: glycosyltransferase family 2 protein [Pseudomonadota bacterium]